MRTTFLGLLLAVSASSAALAQTAPADNAIYTFAEQMPALTDGGSGTAIAAKLQSLTTYPAAAMQDKVEGRVFVSFVVTAAGKVVQPQIVKGLRADVDSAVVNGVRQLPNMVPGRQNGKPVAVRMTAPVSFRLQAPAVAPAPAPDLQLSEPGHPEKVSDKTYTYVEQMPQLPGGGGNAAVVAAIQRALVYPPEAMRKGVEGRVFVSMTVGADGLVSNEKIMKDIGSGCDEAVLAAVRKLPRFQPGTQQGQPVAVTYTLPITFKLAPAPAVKGR